MFTDIEDLLKRNALSSTPLDASRAAILFDTSQVAAPIVEMVGRRLDGLLMEDSITEFISGHLTSSELIAGSVYRVSEDSEFVEATFRVNISAQIELKAKPGPWASLVGGVIGGAAGGVLGGRSVPLSGLAGIRHASVPITAVALVDLSTRVIAGQAGTPEVERVRWETKG